MFLQHQFKYEQQYNPIANMSLNELLKMWSCGFVLIARCQSLIDTESWNKPVSKSTLWYMMVMWFGIDKDTFDWHRATNNTLTL